MDGSGIGQCQLVKFGILVLDAVTVEWYRQRPLLHVHMLHRADIAIEYVLVVVVAYLHDAVTPPIPESTSWKTVTHRIDSLLKGYVQIRGSHHTALHRGQHLDVVGVVAVSLGDAVLDDVDNIAGSLFRVFIFNKEEVGIAPVADVGKDALVNLVSIGNDTARLCLTEDPGQADDGYCAWVDDVAEHVPGSHTRQLVDVADKYQAHR